MSETTLPPEIEVYVVGTRRLYAKTSGPSFALFEDELTPEQLVAIAADISYRQQSRTACLVPGDVVSSRLPGQ